MNSASQGNVPFLAAANIRPFFRSAQTFLAFFYPFFYTAFYGLILNRLQLLEN